MKTLFAIALCCFLINICILEVVRGQYSVEIEFFGYSNPTGRCANCPVPKGQTVHSCCDNFSKTTCTRAARCDSYFHYCLRALGDTSTTSGCSYFGSEVTFANINDAPLNVDEAGSVLGLTNPLQLPGLEEEYRGVQLYIEVIDADFTPRSAPNELVDILLIDLGPSAISGSPPKRQNYTGVFDFVTMDLSVTALCASNRQPPDCTQCAPGFTGENCDVRSIDIDDCAGVNCSGNGICIDGINSFTCLCDTGFTGRLCNINDDIVTDVTDCSSNPCGVRGQCVQDGSNSFLCICDRGFTGNLCQEQTGTTIDVDDCVGVTCSGNGVCMDTGINSFSCKCSTGFTGRVCEINIDDCLSNPCGIHGVCVDGVDTFLCVCDPGYTGRYCQQVVNQCEGVTCSGNGRCVEGEFTFQCICDPGFAGQLCNEININDCMFNTCINGRCVVNSATGIGECACDPGFTGERCQTNIDDCLGVDCNGNGQCVDSINSFRCECSEGFEGQLCNIQRLTSSSDNCSSLVNPCGVNGSQCVDGLNSSYTCQCSPGSQCPQADAVEGNSLLGLAPLIGGSVGTLLLVIFTVIYVCVAVVIVYRIRRRRKKAKEYELI